MTPLYHPRPERWPQLSLKGFFVLVTLLCIFLGWLGVQIKWIHDRQAISIRMLEDMSGVYIQGSGRPAPFPLGLFGQYGLDVLMVPQPEVERAKQLFPEAKVIGSEPNPITTQGQTVPPPAPAHR